MSRERVASLADLKPGEAIQVSAGGKTVALARESNGDVHAVADLCTHAAVSLSEGMVEDCTIECWLHGSAFDLRSGKPTVLPAVTPVEVYEVSLEGDDVYVDTAVITNAAAS
ncbi:non-heme iron oxygenase ferredoxin subunit [Kineosporia succinea]|uniref:3-phenylpropionate/trans-cinnamate dioxygenase ferredoxin subunit n=1 Tax=Kineosporia succinea TaxID=84632 RepID=A0ABT9P7A7_9ACTN|nr:non-heme iron oxygenase ferredoxin subunit [Kineosporia succinea]MDP9828573.1 3-phenylpropionate/trans-cinnamate dioxygenase ferredoxin subunit [Kineosporia succinea]